MIVTVDRTRTDHYSLTVTFDQNDLAVGFPCEDPNTDLYFQLYNRCDKTDAEEVQVAADAAKLIEAGQQSQDFRAEQESEAELDPDLKPTK